MVFVSCPSCNSSVIEIVQDKPYFFCHGCKEEFEKATGICDYVDLYSLKVRAFDLYKKGGGKIG